MRGFIESSRQFYIHDQAIKCLIVLISFCAMEASAGEMDAGQFSLSTGIEMSSGKYGGTTSTDILYVPLTAKYVVADYSLRITVPYISIQSSDSSVLPGIGRMGSNMATSTGMSGSGMGGMGGTGGSTVTSTSSTATTQSGLGDIFASLGYGIYSGEQLGLTLLTGVKFGTADYNKRLGTGQNDYLAEVDSVYTLNDTAILASAGYKIVGQPADYVLKNVAYGSIGFNQSAGERSRAGLTWDVAQSSSSLSTARSSLSAVWFEAFGQAANWSITLTKGFSSSVPDWGGGFVLSSGY